MAYENIITEERGAVAIITLNRPKALNADLGRALDLYEADPGVQVSGVRCQESG